MEQEPLKAIDLEVLKALFKQGVFTQNSGQDFKRSQH